MPDGGGMAVQAVEAYCLMTGVTPDPERVLHHVAEMGRAAGA